MEHKKLHVLIAVLAAVIVGLIAVGAIAYQKASYDSQIAKLESISTTPSTTSADTSSKNTLDVQGGALEISHCDSVSHYEGTDSSTRKFVKEVSSSGGLDDVTAKCYSSFVVSPDKKFVLLSYYLYEGAGVEVYDTVTHKVQKVELASGQKVNNFFPDNAEWEKDGKLSVNGSAGLGYDKNIYESVSASKPWVLKIVGKQQTESDTSSSNIFDATKVKKGDTVGGMTLDSIKIVSNRGGLQFGNENFIAQFSGKVTLTGTYKYDPTLIGPGSQLEFTVDASSVKELPMNILAKDDTATLEFENLAAAKTKLGLSTVAKSGKVTLVIDNYTYTAFPAGGSPRKAELVEVK